MDHIVRFQRRARLKCNAVGVPLADVDVTPVATGVAPEVRNRVQATRADKAINASAEDERPDGERQPLAVGFDAMRCDAMGSSLKGY